MLNPINVAISTDARGILGAVVAGRSIVKNAAAGRPIRIFFVHSGIPDDLLQDIVESLGVPSSEISVHPVRFSTERVRGVLRSSSLPAMAYARLFIDDIVPNDQTRCIYVDIDTITVADITALYDIDLHGKTIAAARNFLSDDGASEFARLGVTGKTYFNSGVMLIDLVRWRALSVGERALEFARQAGTKLILHDQDALNVVLADDWLEISQEWNWWFGSPPPEVNVNLVHCAMNPKPWHADYSGDFRELFISHLEDTRFASHISRESSLLSRVKAAAARKVPHFPSVWQRLWFLVRRTLR